MLIKMWKKLRFWAILEETYILKAIMRNLILDNNLTNLLITVRDNLQEAIKACKVAWAAAKHLIINSLN